jgi:hypothetical protein
MTGLEQARIRRQQIRIREVTCSLCLSPGEDLISCRNYSFIVTGHVSISLAAFEGLN